MKHWLHILALTLLSLLAGCSTAGLGELSGPEQWRAANQPPLDDEALTSLTQGPSLHAALSLAISRNPGIQAARRQWLAAIHTEPQATSLPDPMLQAGYQFDSVETRVGPQRWSLGLNQQLPWWQKLWAKGRRAALQADITRLKFETAARNLIIDVKDAYYELYYLDKALPITERVEALLRNQGLLAYAELETGRTQLSEAFRAESQAAQLGYDRLLLAEQRAAQAERLRSLLNLPPTTPIGPIRAAPVYQVVTNVDALYERAENWAQVLKIRGLEVEQSQYDTFLARLSRVPDIALGGNFISVDPARPGATLPGGMQMPAPKDSGKDVFTGLFSMNLPIWEQRNRALIKEKEALEESMQLRALDELNAVRQSVAQAWFQVRLTERLIELYEQTLLPQAQSVMQQAEVLFRNDQAAFAGTIETTFAWHNFLLARHRAIADHGQAIGRLERAIGTTADPGLTTPPTPLPPTAEETKD
ncbi:TolC family protein [bacterium]|nr:TolC family protein [bacterium]